LRQLDPFFLAEGDAERIVLGALGIEIRVLVPSATSGGQLALFEETTAPGQGPPLHIHHRQTEIFRFLDGEHDVLVGDRRFRARAGDVAVAPAGVPHTFRNVGDAPARMQFILTPGEEGEAFFRDLAPLVAGGPPDPLALAALAERYGTEFVGPPLDDGEPCSAEAGGPPP
jgi:mannose-6-phosphate isomerase-like protein (cupin superfamily)